MTSCHRPSLPQDSFETNAFHAITRDYPFPGITVFHPFHPHRPARLSIKTFWPTIWTIGLSFPFTSPFIPPRAINPFLFLTRANTLLRVWFIFARTRRRFSFHLPFDAATLSVGRSIPPARAQHPLSSRVYHACIRLFLLWWTASNHIAHRYFQLRITSSPCSCKQMTATVQLLRASFSEKARPEFCLLK